MPFLLPFFFVWMYRSDELFANMDRRKRVLMALLIPVVVPIMAYAAIIYGLGGMVRRLVVRRKVLGEADRILDKMIKEMAAADRPTP